MELSKQIKKYRTKANMSQEQLAEKVFVSRQTISNWENDKNYPDLKSLVLLGEVFQVSLDQLVKGDLEEMKKEISKESNMETSKQDKAAFEKFSNIFSCFFLAMIVLPIPLVYFWRWFGLALYICVWGVGMYYAAKVEKYKKKFDIQTYKEIVAFMNGESLDDIEKIKEGVKRPYQNVLKVVVGAILAAAASGIIFGIIKLVA